MKPVVGVFAHPDDEAFGPSGTLAKFAQEGRDVYIICVTKGDAGENHSDKTHDLESIREDELHASAKKLGVKDIFFLNFKDGTLSNNIYHDVADALLKKLEELQPEIVITLENRGISGHLDHIAISFITTYVFKRLSFIKELWYFCITEEAQKVMTKHLGDYFVYVPAGYKKEAINKIVDVSSVWEQKKEAMLQHESQKPDVDANLRAAEELPNEENFIILTKDTE
jgi:LmbE family N-acetylglucosaminyl deacetylase